MGLRSTNNQDPIRVFNHDNLYRDIMLGDYVLVVGEDVILRSEYCDGNSSEYIKQGCLEWIRGDNKRLRRYSEGLTTLRDFIPKMLSAYDENEEPVWDYKSKELSPSLKELIDTKLFPVVLTTCFDEYLEVLMRQAFGEKNLQVINLTGNSNSISLKSEEYGTVKPTLVYVFGKAEGQSRYAFNEDDYMDLMIDWLVKSRKGTSIEATLLNYISTKKILAIGGKNEDWYFRFFWNSLRPNKKNMSGDVAISLDKNGDSLLLNYLDRVNVNNHSEPAKIFLDEIKKNLTSPSKQLLESIHRLNPDKLGGIFISYAHEDYHIVCQIYRALLSLTDKVWFDNDKLEGGDLYDKRIEKAISQCRIFIPVLSSQVKNDLVQGNNRYYKDKEWQLINNNKSAQIIPLALAGFNINEDSRLLPDTFSAHDIIDWAGGGKDSLRRAIEKINY